ncbi:hypothetical protein F511_46754 [Dorcoceras hygrometricum]|uniref:Uncharacterized protein n=1 Tax=Dorcoceras hygrometricum TaxID=472368 RepID=A0A2Z6ZTS4_9LAMI|nr:hypothetical protein F511_46754 [Dorcoceras hygrometricum]
MKRRRAEESAVGLALMTSSVMSSQSADGLREQSQDISSRKLQTQRKDFQTQCLCTQTQEDKSIIEEDSGEAIDKPDASNNSIQP